MLRAGDVLPFWLMAKFLTSSAARCLLTGANLKAASGLMGMRWVHPLIRACSSRDQAGALFGLCLCFFFCSSIAL